MYIYIIPFSYLLLVLDSFIVLTKEQWEILKAISIKTSSSIVHYYLSSYFPLVYSYFFILK